MLERDQRLDGGTQAPRTGIVEKWRLWKSREPKSQMAPSWRLGAFAGVELRIMILTS